MAPVYKLLTRAEWEQAERDGAFHGSAVDLADGYFHCSAANQVAETALRYFVGVPHLMLLVVDAAACGDLRWEPSRNGALFPHIYNPLPTTAVIKAVTLATTPATAPEALVAAVEHATSQR